MRFKQSTKNNFRKVFAVLLAIGMIIIPSAREAEAALSAVGPISPTSGFPLWYQDTNGLKLDLMEAADPYGISDPVNPANPFSQQIGFNAEGFWWSAEASIGDASLVLAMEAAFGGEEAVDGEQSAFGRIRIRADVNEPGTYIVRHPFGTETFEVTTVDNGKEINDTSDIGCFGLPGFPCNFNIPLTSGIGPFLTWDTFNPNPALTDPQLINFQPGYTDRQYIGNPLFDHAITGSPVGQNFFRIEGPNIGGPGVNFIQQNLFGVTGRLAAQDLPVLTEVTPVPTPTTDNTPDYTFSSSEAGTITYGGDCSSATTNANVGNNTVTFNALADGVHNNCTIQVTDSDANQSNLLNVSPFTVDTQAPVIAEVTPVPTPTTDNTPNYTFSSTEAGTITYGGDCSSATTAATVGNNTVTFNSLSVGTHNNCTIKVTDDASNESNTLNVSQFTVENDTTAPAAISDLAASTPTLNSLTLNWTSPGDDANTGTAASYDIRYSTSTITEANFATATQVVGEPTPQVAGSVQNMIVNGLNSGTAYFFAMKTSDEIPNTSVVSNIANGTTVFTELNPSIRVPGIVIKDAAGRHKYIAIIRFPQGINARNTLPANITMNGATAVRVSGAGNVLVVQFVGRDLNLPDGNNVQTTLNGQLPNGQNFTGQTIIRRIMTR